MSDFWFMGGYARYVWPCFGFAAIVVAWNVWGSPPFPAGRKTTSEPGAGNDGE